MSRPAPAPAYNTQLIDAARVQDLLGFVQSKAQRAKSFPAIFAKCAAPGIPWQFLYYSPELGPKYLRRLFSEMDVTMSADLRQAVDWLGSGKLA